MFGLVQTMVSRVLIRVEQSAVGSELPEELLTAMSMRGSLLNADSSDHWEKGKIRLNCVIATSAFHAPAHPTLPPFSGREPRALIADLEGRDEGRRTKRIGKSLEEGEKSICLLATLISHNHLTVSGGKESLVPTVVSSPAHKAPPKSLLKHFPIQY